MKQHPSTPARGRLATLALTLWTDTRTARDAHAARDTRAHCDALTRIDDMRRVPAPPSFHRARGAAIASLTGTTAMPAPRAARDVPPGTSWAFPGLPLAAWPERLSAPDHEPPPSAA